MKFSIIIAAYNLGEMICDAIESCINQIGIARNEYEIITINDGSKDNTLEHINKYKNIENHTIIDKPNGGLSHTRNYGMKIAKGEYILFLDGDDWLTTDALATLLPHIGKQDVIAFPMMYYYSKNNQTQRLQLESRIYSCKEFLKNTIGKKKFNIIPAPKKAYKRSFLIDNGIEFVEGILHEDNPFFIDVMSKCKEVLCINTPLYYYRQNREGSITSRYNIRNFEGAIKGIEYIKHTSLNKNRDVQFLISNIHAFQVVEKFSDSNERAEVYEYYRKLDTKAELFKLLFTARFDIKPFIRNLLLFIDPALLNYIISKL